MKKYFVILLLSLLPLMGWSQGKVYTRKVRIADLETRTTKVVLSGDVMYQNVLRAETSSRWRINAFEFCTPEEYELLKTRNDYYFLRTASDGTALWLVMEKGGKEKDDNPMNEALELARMPICDVGAEDSILEHVGAFLDIMQTFLRDASRSEKAAYGGLRRYNRPGLARRTPAGSLVTIYAGGHEIAYDKDTHELLLFRKSAHGKSSR